MYRRISKYYPGCDGTPLAVDLYLPAAAERIPVIFHVSRNGRRPREDDERGQQFFRGKLREFEFFLSHGYAVCVPEMRGVGASYGTNEGFWSPIDGRDMKAVIDAVAEEEWCNGNAGMYGGSNVGASQHLAAKEQPKHLRAIIPCDCSADFYYQNYPNGVSIIPPMKYEKTEPVPGVPVDDDTDGIKAAEALKGHRFNMGFLEQYVPHMHRDSMNPAIGYAPNMEVPIWNRMDSIRQGQLAPYQYGAFYEPGCTNKIFEFRSFGGKLLLGPWRHTEVYRPQNDFPEGVFDWKSDHLRFFDRYLKGIRNGTEEEPPVLYYTTGDPDPWHYSADFPLDDQTSPELFLAPDGSLGEDVPGQEGTVDYTVRDDIHIFDSMGRLNRRVEKDLTEEERKCLCFITEPLAGDVELTGFPVAELYVTSETPDANFMAVLSEVTPDGFSHFLTDGMIRARSAKLTPHPLLDPLGVPYHSSLTKDDVSLSPDRPLFLAFHLEALSRIVKKGSRLRISIYCGGNGFNQPEGMPEHAVMRFHFSKECPALLRLPVIRPHVSEFRGAEETVYVFKKAVYRKNSAGFKAFPCLQVYPGKDGLHYATEAFTAVKTSGAGTETLEIPPCETFPEGFRAVENMPERLCFRDSVPEIKASIPPERRAFLRLPGTKGKVYTDLYVASVPVSREAPMQMNLGIRETQDLFMDLLLPEGEGPFPVIVHIHGFGGNRHQFEKWSHRFLSAGYAIAGIDYRLMPPDIWPSSALDSAGYIRYLKAHAKELNIDPGRFGLIGGSMGGHLVTWLAAVNGREEIGDIGGNTEQDTRVKAAVALFPPTDLLGFGEDCAKQWPHQPDKVANGDGPFAPVASMIGYAGPGKGMGELKSHQYRDEEPYRSFLALAREASSVSHVTPDSAPLCLIHGMFDCGVQVPMGQSLRMFEALTRAGVKSLCLLNNNCVYGEDPEVQEAAFEFLVSRV